LKSEVLVIVGPTASGKTKLSVELAKRCGGEVVSFDSMQVYRRMDIGTAKPSAEERADIPHHMLDVAEPDEDFSVARYVDLAAPVTEDILRRGKLPILVGGTGLYVDSLLSGRTFSPFQRSRGLREALERRLAELGGEALLEELRQADPDTARRLHPNDHRRIVRALEVYQSTGKPLSQHDRETRDLPPRYRALTIGLNFTRREALWQRIDARVDEMMSAGLVEEVEALLREGISQSCTSMQAIGYKEMAAALWEGRDVVLAAEEIKLRTRQYAKRQLTWFRRNEAAKWIVWEHVPDFVSALRTSTKYMEESGLL